MSSRLLSTCSLVLLGTAFAAGCSSSSAESSTQATSTPQASTAQAGIWTTGEVNTLAADYKRQCAGQQPRSQECEILRSLLVVETAAALERLVASKDQRGVEKALIALDFPDEPEIFAAACGILGRAPATPGIVEKVLPQLLGNRYIEVQRMAATLLAATSDPAAEIGRLWLRNHGDLQTLSPYDEYPDFPAEHAGLGFPKYAGAEWFAPADSDRSVGFWTKDDVATVTQWFAQALHAEAMDVIKWNQFTTAETMAVMKSNEALVARYQEAAGKAFKGDKAAAAQVEAMQKDLEKMTAALEESSKKGLAQVLPADSAMAEARWIVPKRKDGRASTLVLVYPIPGMQRTVIQLAWHLADYPDAWGMAAANSGR
jgi:hypothetical protein